MRFLTFGSGVAILALVSLAAVGGNWLRLGMIGGGWGWRSGISIGPDYVAIPARALRISFDSHPAKPLSEAVTKEYPVVVNGSYFGKKPDGTYYPAGLWLENGKRISQMDPSDPNLGVVVSYHRLENSMRLQSIADFDPSVCSDGCLAFQSGPLIASGGILSRDFAWSWHALEPHERTILGLDSSGAPTVFVFPKPISLPDAGTRILRDHPAIGSLVNLDGGPSTAYASASGAFHADAVLPIVWGIVKK